MAPAAIPSDDFSDDFQMRLSGFAPFERAAELFEDFMRIEASKDVSRRYTEEAEAIYEQMRQEEADEIQKKISIPGEISNTARLCTNGKIIF